MIISQLTGGLGNQLFQYAVGRQLAIRHNTQLFLDTSSFGELGHPRPKELHAFLRPLKINQFNIQAEIANVEQLLRVRDPYFQKKARDRFVRRVRKVVPRLWWRNTHILEKQYRFDDAFEHYSDNIYLEGFWQSYRYFLPISSLLKQELTLRDSQIFESAHAAVEAIRNEFGRVVSLHVRRGDIAHACEVIKSPHLSYGPPVSTSYLQQAISQFDPTSCFFVFSDTAQDIEWCKRNLLARNVRFSNAHSDLWDFTAMRLCDDHIISNSTFSWWAAWLGEKPSSKTVAPLQWAFADEAEPTSTVDLIPKNWLII